MFSTNVWRTSVQVRHAVIHFELSAETSLFPALHLWWELKKTALMFKIQNTCKIHVKYSQRKPTQIPLCEFKASFCIDLDCITNKAFSHV